MKPIKKTRIIKNEYWSCGLDDVGHYHISKRTAQQCLYKQAIAKKSIYSASSRQTEANLQYQILYAIANGQTLAGIARNQKRPYSSVRNNMRRGIHKLNIYMRFGNTNRNASLWVSGTKEIYCRRQELKKILPKAIAWRKSQGLY